MCYNCGVSPGILKIYRKTECPTCGKDLKICLNCRFYDKNAHFECRESITEEVKIKERSNFCDFFEYNKNIDAEHSDELKKEINDAKSEFLKLFGNE